MQYSSIVVSAVLSAFFMPFIISFAQKKGLYDGHGGRKIHNGQIPRLGGVGMFWAFFAVAVFFPSIASDSLQFDLSSRVSKFVPFIAGAAIVHFLGLADDIKEVPARLKLAIQAVAGFIVVVSGFRFQGFGFGSDLLSGSLNWLSFIISWGWIVGITNAINLIDGMDGLAGGISFIISITFGIFYYLGGDASSAFLCLALAGAIAGFLFVNFPAPKAKLFMGDSGSLFLGFSLAVMPFLGQTGSSQGRTVGLIPSIVILAVPMIDTLRAIARRILAGVSISTPDRLHIHHLFFD